MIKDPEFGNIHSYNKIFNLGHKAIQMLFTTEILVEEKLDGSQFSWGVSNGELYCRSKGKGLVVDAPEKMFLKAVETAKELQPLLIPGAIYRGEYLQKPKHNVLCYDRVPAKNIMLFDVEMPGQNFLTWDQKANEASRLGLEVVPKMFEGKINDVTKLYELLNQNSILGSQKIEGFVIKNYNLFGIDGKILMGKYVSEDFKEVHQGEWREQNPTTGDILERLVLKYKTPARYQKAIQHLTERGEITQTLKDIGPLIKEVQKDIEEECSLEIKEELFKYAWDHIARRITGGVPSWYKELLMKSQFE